MQTSCPASMVNKCYSVLQQLYDPVSHFRQQPSAKSIFQPPPGQTGQTVAICAATEALQEISCGRHAFFITWFCRKAQTCVCYFFYLCLVTLVAILVVDLKING